ncbi:hypothetical protein DFJ73DRAFT_584779 [Zopfochytrium polystomum]|nr:hypothetical protein DFJ73DRAFT_584779 [Zopfochytrium polystomum]
MAFAHMAVLAPASRAGEPTGSGTANGSPASVWTTPTSSSSGGNSTFGGARSGASSVVGGGDGGGGGGGTTFPRGTAGGGVVARRIGQFDRGVRLSPAPPSQDSPLPLDAVPAISIESPSMGYSSSMPPLPHKQPARSLSTISSSSSASSVSLASTSSSVGSSISSAAPSSLRPNPATDASYGRQPVHRRSPSPNFATQPRAGITTTPELDPHIESDELESAQPTSPTQSSSPSEPQLLDGEGSGSGSAAVEVISSSLSFIAAAARDVTTPSPAALARSSYSPAVAAAAAALTSAPTNSTFFPPLTRLGLPSRQPRPTVVAYDRSQSLLAVGMSDGTILVVGSPPNFEVLLHPPANCSRNSPIKLLRFKVGERFLLSINKRDELVVWNLVTATPRLPLFKAGAEISAIETPAASGWIYLGLISGKVLVFDLKRNRLAEYSIPCPENVLTRDGAADDSTAVVALSVCPVDSNMLLIGFKGGPMMIWNLEKKSIHRKFVFPLADPSDSILDKQPLEVLPDNLQPLSNPSLSAACWRPDGRAVVGARGPYFAFWSLDDPMSAPELSCHKPVIIRSVDGSPSVSDSHMQNINQVEWIAGVDSAASSANISYLLVSGGNRSGDLRGVSIFTVSSDSPYVTDNRKAVLAHDAGIIQFCSFVHVQYTGNNHFSRLPSNPSLPQTCAVSPNDVVIISITESGTIKSHAFHQRVNSFTGLSLSPSLTLLGLPELLGFSIDTISPSFLEDLRQTCSAPQLEKISAAIENVSSNTPLIQSSAPPTPLTGGSASSSIIAAALTAAANGLGSNSSYSRIAPPDLLITAHCDSTLRFWHPDPTPFASPSPPVPLVTLPLTHLITLNRPTGASPVPTHVWFDGSQRSITVASGVAVVVLRYVSLKEAEASPAPASQAAVLTLSSATFPRKYFAHDAAKSNSANSSRSIKPRTSSASQSSGKGTAANSIPARPYPKRTQSVQVLPSSAPTSLPLTSNSGDHSPTSISDGGLQEMSNEEMELLMRKLAPHGVDGTGSLIDLDDDGPHDGNGYSTSSRTPSLNGSIPSPSGSIGGGGVVGPSPTDTSPTLAATKTNSLLLAGGNGSLPHSPVLQPSSPNASVGVWGSVFRKESPNPPNVTGFSESRQGAASSGPETGQSTSIPPTVIVDRFKKGKNGATLIPGWATIAQATYTDAVVVSSYAGWLNILATGLVDGTLCVVDILTGKTVLTDSFGILHNGAPNEVVILHFCETYVDKDVNQARALCWYSGRKVVPVRNHSEFSGPKRPAMLLAPNPTAIVEDHNHVSV